jgi:uncharacterized OsmC-like protein
MVAEAMGIETERIEVEVEGDLSLAGTLGVSKDVPVGFERIRTRFNVVAPEATQEQLDALQRKTEQDCVVLQTLVRPAELETEWASQERLSAQYWQLAIGTAPPRRGCPVPGPVALPL